jgi:hypothetical protein
VKLSSELLRFTRLLKWQDLSFRCKISYPGESNGAQSCAHELPNNAGVAVCCWVKRVEMRRVPVGQLD